MVRWYSFFVYHATKYEESGDMPDWKPWNTVVDLGQVRTHDDVWLIQWLVDNAHTYRASIDAMKRGVSRTDEDPTASFLKSTFEGIELIEDVPEWMIYDDPVRHLYDEDPAQWAEMISWLKNVTGQQLDVARREDRTEQEEDAIEEQKTRAKNVRDVLTAVVSLVDSLSRAKRTDRAKVVELREQLRVQLYWYATAAGGVQRLRATLDELKQMTTRRFNDVMSAEYARLGVPDPNAEPYRSMKGKKRVAAIVAELFPEIPELNSGNVFADSKLFDPKWFRIDEEKHTVYLEEFERARLQRQFGQDPELLVRRATRAMWESRNKEYDALWGVMMSYFSWVMPPGREMESRVVGIPVAELGDESLNIEARQNWLKAWTYQMQRLARGESLEDPSEFADEPEEQLEPWQEFLKAEEARREDPLGLTYDIGAGLDVSAQEAMDYAMSNSVYGTQELNPQELLERFEELEERRQDLLDAGYSMQEVEDLIANGTRRRMLRNGTGTAACLEGEKPTRWYQVDLYGRRLGELKPNAPPLYVSPGVVYRAQKRTFMARQLLPSPFRMVSGIGLE
jgi:hypothetical protein